MTAMKHFEGQELSLLWVLHTTTRFVVRECFPARGGALPYVAALIDIYRGEFLSQEAFAAACKRGVSASTLEFFLQWTAPDWMSAIYYAAEGGHLHVLQWMVTKRFDNRGPWKGDFEYALEAAAGNGQIDTVKWLCNCGYVRRQKEALLEAAGNGHLPVVQLMHEMYQDDGVAIDAMSRAAANGHLEIVKWLYSHIASPQIKSAIGSAARNGRPAVVKWLYEKQGEMYSSYLLEEAATGGHLGMFKWALDARPDGLINGLANIAACSGHFDMVKLLYERYEDRYFAAEAMDTAAAHGHLATVKWLHEHSAEGCTTKAMDRAARTGHLEVVQWLHENRQEGCTTEAMDGAARSGKLKVVQWLHENRHEGCTSNAMDKAAQYGHLSVVKWLHENRSEGCTTDAMDEAAKFGRLELVQYLCKHRTEGCTRKGMLWAAQRGDLEICCLLYDNCSNRIALREVRDAAGIGCLEVAKALANATPQDDWKMQDGYLVDRCISKVLTQVKCLPPQSPRRRQLLHRLQETMEYFHDCGYDGCVFTIIQLGLRHGHWGLIQWLLKHASDVTLAKHVKLAVRKYDVAYMRLLIENNVVPDTGTAFRLLKDKEWANYAEVTWWLPESLRVSIVHEALREEWSNWKELVAWILERTSFEEENARHALRDTMKQCSTSIMECLTESVDSEILQRLGALNDID